MRTTVLIAEDEFAVRLTIAEFLRDEGYDVIEACNADEAFEIFKSGRQIDLLFTDVRMPGSMDGCELAKRVRAGWPATSIIVTSGYSEVLLSARDVIEDFVLPKPYRLQAVLTTIRSVTGSSAAPA